MKEMAGTSYQTQPAHQQGFRSFQAYGHIRNAELVSGEERTRVLDETVPITDPGFNKTDNPEKKNVMVRVRQTSVQKKGETAAPGARDIKDENFISSCHYMI